MNKRTKCNITHNSISNTYLKNTHLLQNTLLPYFCDEYPLVSLNKLFSNLNYERYNTHTQPHGIIETYNLKTKNIEKRENYRNGKLHGLYEEWYDGQLWERKNYKNGKL